MVNVKRGIVIKCDPAMRQFLKHLNETKAFGRAFIINVRLPTPPIKQPENQNIPTLPQQNNPNVLTLEFEQLKNDEQNNPKTYYSLSRMRQLIAKLATRYYYNEESRMLLFKSSSKLYYDCSNGFNYISLHKEFGLEDNFDSWYRLTLLHIWLILTRLQQSMEAYSYCYLKRMITQNFHHDKTHRYNTIFKDHAYAKLKRRTNFRQLYFDVYMSSLFEYDDGFLGDDKHLSGAIWRSLYLMDDNIDIIYIERVVCYIRSTLHFLNNIDVNLLLVKGIDNWRITEKIVKNTKEG
ncbi:hypothetical protein Mgra_00007556 [Meloidogyne graminicola]|uniref:Ubiquinol-cytochrome c chaperone domain-containing protein n=1 Tax=Meloidogyne graminicola TaxID=189291 RepID=A0A8S9ZI60_9BILA|nr:hypothetical protein Mgra_00007556 [Meloidogyne graminicola]